MKLTITNLQVLNFTQFFNVVSAKGKHARAVAKFMKLVEAKRQEYAEDEYKIVNEYGVKDEDGQLIDPTTYNFRAEDAYKAGKEMMILKNEEVVIDLTEFEPYMSNLIEAIENNNAELKGNDLLIFDELLTELEKLGGN
ncbi:DUF1617 family protein [Vagococcus silagei]|uniref:DUF1617 family protein n=1 Tax=Vagococcus silagei TaxID=2508885 RepID=A0A4S3B5L2_9ENTE|nr:DUF1617 family protein [Vagococcus silagei]THB62172.1 DUF1617 family protein [Vagococcus silagei]